MLRKIFNDNENFSVFNSGFYKDSDLSILSCGFSGLHLKSISTRLRNVTVSPLKAFHQWTKHRFFKAPLNTNSLIVTWFKISIFEYAFLNRDSSGLCSTECIVTFWSLESGLGIR